MSCCMSIKFKFNIFFLQDIPIEIPAPLNTIPDQILPSHIVVPRCTGKIMEKRKTFVYFSTIKLSLNSIDFTTGTQLFGYW